MFYLLLILFFSVQCNTSKQLNQNDNVKINLYESGSVTVYNKNFDDLKPFIDNVFKNTDEILRLYADAEYLNNIKNNYSAIEIEFSEAKPFQSSATGQINLKKIFIPLSGDLAGNQDSPIVTLIIGENSEYISSPFRANNALNSLNEMVSFVKKP